MSSRSALLLAAILPLNLAAAAASLPASAPEVGRPVLVIAPPWVDAEGAILAAGGLPILPIRAPLAVLASFPNADFPDRLVEEGAWSVDAGALAWICGVSR